LGVSLPAVAVWPQRIQFKSGTVKAKTRSVGVVAFATDVASLKRSYAMGTA